MTEYKYAQYSSSLRQRDRVSGYYKKSAYSPRVSYLKDRIGHHFFVKETSTGVVISKQKNDSITFNKNGPMSLGSFMAYFEHRPKECLKCKGE